MVNDSSLPAFQPVSYTHLQTDAPVVISLRELQMGFKVKSAVVMEGSDEIPSQLDDLNLSLIHIYSIINGIPDWVYEEEFGFNRALEFSADNTMIAFIRFDESEVPSYSCLLYTSRCV